MAGLKVPTAAILAKSPGNVQALAARIAASKAVNPADAAKAIVDLQQQIDQIVKALTKPGQVTEFDVTDSRGALIAWIGGAVVGIVSYVGAWFKQLYIGGTSPADAVIVADAAGDVTINGASITLIKNDVKTVLDNIIDPISGAVQSLTSQDVSVAHGDYSAVTPDTFILQAWDPVALAYQAVATLHDVGNTEGRLLLSKIGTSSVVALTAGAAPTLQISDGTDISTVSAIDVTSAGTSMSALLAAIGGAGGSIAALTAAVAGLTLDVATLTATKADHGTAISGTVTSGPGAGGAVSGTVS